MAEQTGSNADRVVLPQETLISLLAGMQISRALWLAAELALADLLQTGPKSIATLAKETNTNADMLYRMMRMLATHGVFTETEDGHFRQNPVSQLLCAGVNGSLRDLTRMWGDYWSWDAWRDLTHTIRTGETVVDHVHGMNLWEYFAAKDPQAGALFSEAMSSFATTTNDLTVAAYDFAQFSSIADIGGAYGSLLLAILGAHPKIQGILFDRPSVIASAQSQIPAEFSARCELVSGDFFDAVPAGAEAYVMRFIIHDWDDERASRILTNCRRAIPAEGRLLLVEQVIESGNGFSFTQVLDLSLAVTLGGRERTRDEYGALLRASGFELTHVHPVFPPYYIIEAVPA